MIYKCKIVKDYYLKTGVTTFHFFKYKKVMYYLKISKKYGFLLIVIYKTKALDH